MSEYWVSQPKFYCKYCNCHIADNKASISHHENGGKHKEKLDMFNKQKRDEKLHGARSEQDLQRQLNEINRAAKEALVVDRTQTGSTFYSNMSNGQAPAPPAPRPPNFPPGFKPPAPIEEVIEEENSGIYSIRGKTYLDGKIFENKIKVGIKCEIFLETLDEWVDGEVLRRMETPVPNTKVTINSFDVTYQMKVSPDSEKMQAVNERRVKSDRIRLLVNDQGEVQMDDAPTLALRRGAEINQNTGLGLWQTVSVRTVDEQQEWLDHQAAREEHLDEHNKSSLFSSSSIALVGGGRAKAAVEDDSNADSALGAYDPYNTNVYRGVHLKEDVQVRNGIESLTYGEVVTFKKRKVLDTILSPVTGGGGETDYVTIESKVVDGAEEIQVVAAAGDGVTNTTVRKIGSARNFRRKTGDL